MAVSGDRLVLQRIEELLDAPPTGDATPSLESMEETLTEGYAKALALEAERSRVTDELITLATRLTSVDVELGKLRTQLDRLQARTRALRKSS
jgi:phage shock protein A